jgi:two-component system sensor histidine kinase and response regulator WspE
MSTRDIGEVSMLDLFRMEAEGQTLVLTTGLLALERDETAAGHLEACMRAAHSLKGAARIVGLTAGVNLSHAMEECFVAAQHGDIVLSHVHIDRLLASTDLLTRITTATGIEQSEVDECIAGLTEILRNEPGRPVDSPQDAAAVIPRRRVSDEPIDGSERVLRVTAENLNRLLALAGESLVESRWVKPFADSMLRLKRLQQQSAKTLEKLGHTLPVGAQDDPARAAFTDVQRLMSDCQHALGQRLQELEMFDRRTVNLSNRLYDEAIACRMRPFADGIQGLPRMVRDVARSLGKEAKLEIVGESTQVDRDILAKLDAPLGHLLRNAVDHGVEGPDQRRAAGKPAEGIIRLEARHSAGALYISITDDGHGVDLEKLRKTVIERNFIHAQAADVLSDAELLEFLFLPGFSMKGVVTDISGRGVGLDVVRDMVRQVRGTVRVSSQAGKGTQFHLQLPVTLSVVRTLLADISGEPYAFPLAHIVRALKLPKARIRLLEGRQHFDMDGRSIGLVTAHQVLETGELTPGGDELSVVVVGDASHVYGLVVDRFLGERELVVHPLEGQFGKIEDIAAGALMPDGSPVLIVDVEDLMRSIDKLVSGSRLSRVASERGAIERQFKRVLVVDDSLTVRELERKLLSAHGYEVETAVDGMEGWNAVRTGHFNLVITDIDMPRMDGIELVGLINKDPNLGGLPVMVVSYKDREEDRQRGLQAGAAYYLTKGSFHDQALLQAVIDLIGEPDA